MRTDVVAYILAVFVLAGFVKGVIGLGLPTISMGLLALVMPPVEAAAVVVLPSLLTNVWQMLAGRSLASALKRLWPMMLGICAGTWAGAGLMTGVYAPFMSALLGATLLLYALSGLTAFRFQLARRTEPWLSLVVGGVTGIITAATGVSVIPAGPYLQAIGLEKDDLVQALGLSFTVSTLALAVNIVRAGAIGGSQLAMTLASLAAAIAGMGVGQAIRAHLPPLAFRRCFFGGLLLLGLYLIAGVLR